MTASNYGRAFALVLVHEGGYSNNPRDNGGPTCMGITIATLRGFRGRHVDVGDVKGLTKAEAGLIYRKNYWDAIKGDQLPPGVDYAVFDFAVNSGTGRAAKFLQMCLRVEADGQVGPATLHAAYSAIRPQDLINSLCDRRLVFLYGLDDWVTFGKGWSARVAGVRKEALAMVSGVPVLQAHQPDDPGAATTKPATSARTATGAIAAGGTVVAAVGIIGGHSGWWIVGAACLAAVFGVIAYLIVKQRGTK